MFHNSYFIRIIFNKYRHSFYAVIKIAEINTDLSGAYFLMIIGAIGMICVVLYIIISIFLHMRRKKRKKLEEEGKSK
ncbi:MAG: hypothetical protein GF353_02635 [Candidatus Lokiarchaeota archaeon]|nr:hypothetical protein [Candidatus Lokiarchaeota archaeon]